MKNVYRGEKIDGYFNIVDNFHLHYDYRVNLSAMGLLCEMLGQKDDWDFYVSELLNHIANGEKGLRTAMKELISLGYLHREKSPRRGGDGSYKGYRWIVYERPDLNPHYNYEKEMPEDLKEHIKRVYY